ncbi:MAG: hypothetical protein K8S62_12010 [Candidatus Sabulitectum sp.]|nr:hypothetical protein [Candidatus Sabulitectum sp.]
MFKIHFFPLIFLLFITSGCMDENNTPDAVTTEETIPVLSVPGTILLPDTDGFIEMEESNHDAILLYCWLPLGEYPESERDLEFLATVNERGIIPVPVQFSTEVRNASQTQLNTLGISISVALGDNALKDFLVEDNLPAAALVRADGTVVRAYGFGCAERTLRRIQ